MSQKTAKMLRRLKQDDKKGKRKYNTFNQIECSIIRADYLERGDTVRKDYTAAKRKAKQERIHEQVSNS